MVNQQKGVQQETAYSAVVVNDDMYVSPSLYCLFFTQKGHINIKK